MKLSEEDRLAQEKIREFEEAEKAKIRKKEEESREKRKQANKLSANRAELLTEDNKILSEEGGHINITV